MCTRCDSPAPAFVNVPPERGFGGWVAICEACASKTPDFYYRYMDLGGTYSPSSGTRAQIEEDLLRILEREGRRGLDACEVFLVPGKYLHKSDQDKRTYGEKLFINATLKGQVKL